MKLEIVLRTCDKTNVHNDWRVRYHNIPKQDLVIGCTRSLINSIKNTNNIDIKLTILDDHSSEQTVNKLKKLIKNVEFDCEFIQLGGEGYNNSGYHQWVKCRDTDSDLFYSVEDDYLHVPTAIQEMVDSYYLFCDRLKHDKIVIYPFDEPSEYNPPNRKDFIVHGSNRHWRTGVFTTQVMMASPNLLREYWQIFETLTLKYNGDYLKPRTEHYEEANTIWPIWNGGPYIRFNPITSLAIHMQFEQQKDPYINWKQWWSDYK